VSDLLIVLIVILIIVLAIRGPSMLPKLGAALGRGVKEARDEVGSAIRDEPTSNGEPPSPPEPRA
jgi:Sec-independent protein translocase protein TatA